MRLRVCHTADRRRSAHRLTWLDFGGEPLFDFLRASEWRLTAVRSSVFPGRAGPSGEKLGVLTQGVGGETLRASAGRFRTTIRLLMMAALL
jgi:hypothetical protein